MVIGLVFVLIGFFDMEEFRELLKKIGSGPHTGKSLDRSEAALAMRKMLQAEATPAQIGAFLIAHRIKRPTADELAGMLDTWQELGPALQPVSSHQQPVRVFGIPYDGRSRTAPISPIISLLLTALGVPVILHGDGRLPTKYGIPLIDLWQGLGVDWTALSLEQVQRVFAATGLGFIYTPRHFPLAHGLVTYRDQIGKRPPIATLELLWSPYAGPAHLIFGYVHPPTEKTALAALAMRSPTWQVTTVKGLEGSCDLPHDRTVIIGTQRSGGELQRILLHHQEAGISNHNPPLTDDLLPELKNILAGQPSPLTETVLWNGGFYLWHCGMVPDLATGMLQTATMLKNGQALEQLGNIQELIESL
jgi:anthranilate phosphoribosyltransferase